jgi:hypothetical protein
MLSNFYLRNFYKNFENIHASCTCNTLCSTVKIDISLENKYFYLSNMYEGDQCTAILFGKNSNLKEFFYFDH